MIIVQLISLEYFSIITTFLLSWANFSYTFKLILVLCILPLILNAIQAWVQDNFLKKKYFSKDDEKVSYGNMEKQSVDGNDPKDLIAIIED